jgi:1-acyl-sn-glycerol-3-phosphate acyltransferase
MALLGDRSLYRILALLGPASVFELARAVALGSPRSLVNDTRRILARLPLETRRYGVENIPREGSFVLVANHFQTPAIWVGLVGAVLSVVVADNRAMGRESIHWLALSEWRWFEVGNRWVPNPVSSLVFPRACRVWGMIPTPARPSDVVGRAAALRRLLAVLGTAAKRNGTASQGAVVAVFPEGTASEALVEARPGVGAFLQRLSARGVPLLPAGVYWEEGALVVRFGAPFLLAQAPVREDLSLDDWARRKIMVSIGHQLPSRLWGVYAPDIAQSTAERVGLD